MAPSTATPWRALLVGFAVKAGADPALIRKQLPRADEIPFDAVHRFMATLHHSHEGRRLHPHQRARRNVFLLCASNAVGDRRHPVRRGTLALETEAMAARASAFSVAVKPVAPDKRDLAFADVDGGRDPAWALGLLDPPREEAIAAVADCRTAGIRVVMITGDHARDGCGDRPPAGHRRRTQIAHRRRRSSHLDGAGLRAAARDTTRVRAHQPRTQAASGCRRCRPTA